MNTILATDYGNFYAFLIGVPVAFLAFLLIVLGVVFRQRLLHFMAGILSFLAGIRFYTSLPDAKGDDVPFTIILAFGAFLLMGIAIFAVVTFPRRPDSIVTDESKSNVD